MSETSATDLSGLPEVSFEAGATLMEQGTSPEKVFVLKEGSVTILTGGKEVYKEQKPGTFIGEISVLLDEPHNATVKAITDCVCYEITDLLEFVTNHPEVALNVARTLAARVLRLNMILREVEGEATHLEEVASAEEKPELTGLRKILERLDEITDRDLLHPLTPSR